MGPEWSRMWASASFVGVLIVIGLPLWWKTTEVFRVALPYDRINAFDTEAHYVTTRLTILACDEKTAADVADEIQKAFDSSDVIRLKIDKYILHAELQNVLNTVADEEEATEKVGEIINLDEPNTFYVVQRKPLNHHVWVGPERLAFFRDSGATSKLIDCLTKWIYQPSVLLGARSELADEARQVRFPSGSGYHIVLSVVHPKPHKLQVDFDAAEAVEDYVGTFVDKLSELHNFTLKSQWLYLLDFEFQARKAMDSSEVGYHYAVRQERLHSLLTKLEERAATHVSEQPTMNLALYVVPCEISPLYIYDQNDKKVESPVQAFMSPKWGGVVLCSPECGAGVYRPRSQLVMGTFVSQLRKLLGITEKVTIDGVHLVPLHSVSPRDWEVDTLLRIRTLEQVSSAERSLKSLAKLLGEISNIVINEDVGASITTAVTNIHDSSELMMAGELRGAHEKSRVAFLAAETAFMEPSLLALLYFPDDQKYAIYIPLFLPIMFPVILSLKNLVLWLKGASPKEKLD
ncbi:GPI transamidase component PIG-S isoform X2 [Leptidea sinapis]|uniref:GPI transamidase component PIG-S isoform X2 n=1 Tax=Leptidea sinapis TaxID=189913 RepID=UPI00213C44DE|nr:GPI transamidase component PIG-S isoform X2 [Leptidea sinapis]